MEILENSKRLLTLRKMGILDLNIDNFCNDAIEEQLNRSGEVLSDWAGILSLCYFTYVQKIIGINKERKLIL